MGDLTGIAARTKAAASAPPYSQASSSCATSQAVASLLPILPLFQGPESRDGRHGENCSSSGLNENGGRGNDVSNVRQSQQSSLETCQDASSECVSSSPVVLASASARRIELCRTLLGLQVESIPSSFESNRDFERPSRRRGIDGVKTEDSAGRCSEVTDEETEFLLLALEGGCGAQVSATHERTSWPAKEYALKSANGKARSVAEGLWKELGEVSSPAPSSHVPFHSPSTAASLSASSCCSSSLLPSPGTSSLPARCVVIGADTIIELDGEVLEKPADISDARRTLETLSGRSHEVHTAVCIYTRRNGWNRPASAFVETTHVTFMPLSEADIEAYLRTGESMDKAGSYGVQGAAGQFVSRIEGCYFNVVGLPVQKLSSALASLWRRQAIV
ncbi:septum formation protein maf [Cystoisospora suis]|uniref:Septum formation protein maf n=1 Tax=Cystoisospora suis TaxID=483139 RepID=A0A2C6LF07_9APIC|nr:septum formation protein maf [Cystoisospora suis]